MKVPFAILSLLLIFGALKLNFEKNLAAEYRAAHFHATNFNLDLREEIGQTGFIAALSGFRSMVADLLWLEGYTAWERTEWGRLLLILKSVTTLQPRSLYFWENAAWHMAWNASVDAMQDPSVSRRVLRIKARNEYIDIGKNFLIQGIQNNPDRYLLYERLGTLYREKLNDHCAAAREYDIAKNFPDAPPYLKRLAAFELSYCEGKEWEAYNRLVELYKMGKKEHVPTLFSRLEYLEEKLKIPPNKRIYYHD